MISCSTQCSHLSWQNINVMFWIWQTFLCTGKRRASPNVSALPLKHILESLLQSTCGSICFYTFICGSTSESLHIVMKSLKTLHDDRMGLLNFFTKNVASSTKQTFQWFCRVCKISPMTSQQHSLWYLCSFVNLTYHIEIILNFASLSYWTTNFRADSSHFTSWPADRILLASWSNYLI